MITYIAACINIIQHSFHYSNGIVFHVIFREEPQLP